MAFTCLALAPDSVEAVKHESPLVVVMPVNVVIVTTPVSGEVGSVPGLHTTLQVPSSVSSIGPGLRSLRPNVPGSRSY